MSRRKILESTSNGHTVKVHFDSDWKEYRVTLDGKQGDAVYFTNDEDDAKQTAIEMLKRAIAADQRHPTKVSIAEAVEKLYALNHELNLTILTTEGFNPDLFSEMISATDLIREAATRLRKASELVK